MTDCNNTVMTSSLPNLDTTKSELDKLSDRLGKLKPLLNSGHHHTAVNGSPVHHHQSRLPKPEISPKPAHLVAQLAKPKIPSPKNGLQTSAPSTPKSTPTASTSSEPSTNSANSPAGTSSMLKSTLKRITKLTTSPAVARSQSFRDPTNTSTSSLQCNQYKFNGNYSFSTNSLNRHSLKKRKQTAEKCKLAVVKNEGSSNTMNYPLSRSGTEPIPPPPIQNKPNGHPSSMTRSSSLRRVKNKDLVNKAGGSAQESGTNTLNYPLNRSGTLDRNGIKRTPSMTTVRRFRDRDLNVKLSRGIQTQLTKDTVDEPDFNDDGGIPTNIDFTVYLPDLFGGDTDQVETHVSEPTEPVDVRKNRQLTLDNMKLHRELEKLKQSASEYDLVKKELRNVKTKLDEEQKLRSKMEHQLDMHNKKVKEIATSMDCVEREFEKRDATIYDLEGQVKVEKGKVEHLESELQKASKIIESHRAELGAARKSQKTLVEQCEHIEGESRELQEFLQIEKLALSETLKDSETEVEKLKEDFKNKDIEVKEAEERCMHLVRLGEQRYQELLTSQQQLKTFSDMAKDLMMNQGTELYQISHKLRTLTAKLSGKPVMSSTSASETKDSQIVKQEIEQMFHQLENEPKSDTNVLDSLQNLSLAIEKRRKSETLMSANGKCDNDAKIHEQIEQLEQLVETLMQNGYHHHQNEDQNDKNSINIDDSMNRSLMINGETMEEMKIKFAKHQQIYKTNYELAESEIKRMDELYQDLIENVLKTFKNIPEIVNTQPDLQRLKEMLETETSLTSPTNGFGSKKVSLENSFKTIQQEDNLSL